MKIVSQPYKYFGRQCKHCGTYFTYTPQEALVGLCPYCSCPFDHSIDDDDVDFEPDARLLEAHQKLRGKASSTILLPEYNVGQTVYIIYDTFYSTLGTREHTWCYAGEATISEISCQANSKEETYIYTLDKPIFISSSGVPIKDTSSGAIHIEAKKEYYKHDPRLSSDVKASMFPDDQDMTSTEDDEEDVL